ncbi:acyltransferase family protein [soil metagenome]
MHSNAHSAYRPDIDGLRALAVLAVIAFHASSTWVSGGFVGVDIFFVISGFLISGIIYRDLEKERFSFSVFYTRRIKRILPAYIVVAAFTLAFSSWLLIPNDYIFYTTSLAASWSFASNIFFSMLSWGYFGQRTEEFPLLHTWSLSVEEQFYFIFPLLLVFLFRRFRKHIPAILVVAAVIFLAISEARVGKVGSYFLLPYRAHELIIGVLAFFAVNDRPLKSAVASTALSIAGMSLMLGSIFLLTRKVSFPGINSLYPCLGAALVLYAGSFGEAGGSRNIVIRFLASRAMVFIGLLSYSLYLWHWPIFSFLRYRQIELTYGVITAAISLTAVLAYLTWKYVEMPIRGNRRMGFKPAFFRFYVAPAAVFVLVGAISYLTEGAPQRFSADFRQLIASYSFERDLTRSCSIRSGEYKEVSINYLMDNCAFGVMGKKRAEVLLFGDSHANHFKPFVEDLSKHANLKSVYFVEGSCDAIDLFDPEDKSGASPTACQKRNADLLQMAGQFKFVVLASFWSYKGKEELFAKRLAASVKSVIAAGATPVIFKDNPYHLPDLSQCVLFKRRGWIDASTNCNIPYSFVRETQDSMNDVIDEVGRTNPRVVVIDPKDVMCNAEECATSLGNTALYKDANHLNSKAAALLAQRYLQLRGNPFLHQKHHKLTWMPSAVNPDLALQ